MFPEIERLVTQLREAILAGDENTARETTHAAIRALGKGDPMTLIATAVQPALDVIGERFRSGEAYLPELILSGDAARASIEIILPLLADGSTIQKGIVVIGSPRGDLHDIGKNIVGALLTAYGYKVVDVGVDVAPHEFVKAAEREGALIIAASTLLSTCLPYQREIIHLLCDMQIRERFFVICGGGPVTPEWVEEIHADGYGREATDAIVLCNQLVSSELRPPLAQPIVVGALKRKREVQTT